MSRDFKHRAAMWIAVAASGVACIALQPAVHASAASREVAKTLQQVRAALGAPALERGGTLVLESRVVVSGLTGAGSSAAEIGGTRLAERTSTPPIASGDGYDGTTVWNREQSGLVWADGSDAGVSQEINAAYAADDSLFVPGSRSARVVWGGFQNVAGRRFATLIVTPPHSRLPMRVWIDATSHVPVKYAVQVGPVSYETDLSEYRPIDGLLVARRVVSKSSQGNESDVTITSARIVAPDEAAFAKPRSQVHDFSVIGNSTSTSAPMEVIGNHVYLNVTLNGKGPYRFVFDTGGSNTIDPAVAKEIKAAGSGLAQDSGTGAGTESFSFATIDSLRIGNAILRRQVFSVEPIRHGFGVAAGERVDGLIGFEVLARYITTFDYANRTVTLAMPAAAQAGKSHIVPFVFAGTLPQLGCTVDGIPSECWVDTGDGGSVDLFAPFIATHPQIVPAMHSAVGINGYGVGGGHSGFMGRLRSLQLADFTLGDLVAGYSTQKEGGFAAPFIAANVGGGVWKRFTVTFDYGHQTMALQPNASLGAHDSYDRAGLILINKAGRIVVYAVRDQTPAAEAGFVKGDVIVSIDGVDANSLEQIRAVMRSAPGSVLHVRVADNGGSTRMLTLTLRDWV